jgi:hypothetical protein
VNMTGFNRRAGAAVQAPQRMHRAAEACRRHSTGAAAQSLPGGVAPRAGVATREARQVGTSSCE